MREIKFRAWDIHLKRFLLRAHPNYWGLNFINDSKRDFLTFPKDSDIIVMQFTGLKDKNGKEIYEHDIVIVSTKYPKKKIAQIVGWDTELGRWCFTYDSGEAMRDIARGEKDVLEIIGNCYENPDLIKTN